MDVSSSAGRLRRAWPLQLLLLCVHLCVVRGQLNVFISHPAGLLDAGLPRANQRQSPPPRGGAQAGARAPPFPPIAVDDAPPPPASAGSTRSPPPRRRSPPPRRLLAPPPARGGNHRHRELLASDAAQPGSAPSYSVTARLQEAVNATHSIHVSIDLGEQGRYLVTGSWLEVPATFYLNPAVAQQLGLAAAAVAGASGDSSPPLSPAEAAQVAAALSALNNTSERRPLGDLAAQGLLRLLDGLSVAARRARPFNSQPAAWPATGVPSAVASGPVRQVARVEPKQEAWGPELGQPREVSALVFLFEGAAGGCGLAPLSADAVRAALTGTAGPSLQSTLKACSHDTYRLLGPSDAVPALSAAAGGASLVLGPVPLGGPGGFACSGRTAGGGGADYDLASGCGEPEAGALAEAALEWLRRTQPAVAAALPGYRRTLLLAASAACFAGGSGSGGGGGAQAFHGLVSAGCPAGGPCTSWLFVPPGSSSPDPAQLLHALGHNEGVPHAAGLLAEGSTEQAAVADPTDPMGSAGAGVCFAAPNAYKLGWSSPVSLEVIDPWTGATSTSRADLPLSELPAGVFTEFQLPAMALERNSLLRLVVEQAGLPAAAAAAGSGGGLGWQRALFLSYRVRQQQGNAAAAYDGGLPEEYDMRVWLHESNETATGAPAAAGSHTLIRAMLQPPEVDNGVPPADGAAAASPPPWPVGSTFRYLSSDPGATGGHLAVAVRRRDGQSATVALCRFTTEEEGAGDADLCYNGLDDDCDGLSDSEDPSCQ